MTSKKSKFAFSLLPRQTRKGDGQGSGRSGKLVIYASGDVTSQAICQLMIDKGVSFDRRDIRKAIPGEGMRDLAFLQRRNLDTVPQLFDADGHHIGGFEEARMHLVRIPDLKPGLASA